MHFRWTPSCWSRRAKCSRSISALTLIGRGTCWSCLSSSTSTRLTWTAFLNFCSAWETMYAWYSSFSLHFLSFNQLIDGGARRHTLCTDIPVRKAKSRRTNPRRLRVDINRIIEPQQTHAVYAIIIRVMFWLLQVEWDDEKNCFQTIAAALGNFYAMHPPLLPNPAGDGFQFYKKNKQDGSSTQDGNNGQSNTGTELNLFNDSCLRLLPLIAPVVQDRIRPTYSSFTKNNNKSPCDPPTLLFRASFPFFIRSGLFFLPKLDVEGGTMTSRRCSSIPDSAFRLPAVNLL